MTIDCGRFAANLGEMAQQIRDERRRAAAERGRLRGLGIACFLETSRGTPGERAEIRFEADGRVALVLGTQSKGQGHETSFAQIAADLLGLPLAATFAVLNAMWYELMEDDAIRRDKLERP